jgi:hypothetical protein
MQGRMRQLGQKAVATGKQQQAELNPANSLPNAWILRSLVVSSSVSSAQRL